MSSEKRALIVDDEPDIRELLEITLGRMGLDTRAAADVAEAHELLGREAFDLCLTDMNLPDGTGIELVRHIGQHHAGMPVAVITAHGSVDTAIESLKAGAFDYVQKPVDLAQLRALVDQALRLGPMPEAVPAGPEGPGRLLGESEAMRKLRRQVGKLARSQAPIYIQGESGAGKEIVARTIHEQGPRVEGPFVPVNCGAIPGELMESEFFGHKKGAFTGATTDKIGLFQAASGGTLFLDEVADLPLAMQVKLLRAIQEKAVRPVGSQQEVTIDVRILSATHKDLAQLVERGEFRQDLYYRLNVIELRVPSLRERRDDIPAFTEMILRSLATEYQIDAPRVSPAAMVVLKNYEFPGNVRELRNVLERAFTLCENDVIEPQDLHLSPAVLGQPGGGGDDAPPYPRAAAPADDEDAGDGAGEGTASVSVPPPAEGESLEDYLENIEKDVIMEALEATRWNKTAAAKRLGITFRALRYRLKKLDLE
jgi:two-component system response regulator PilR (NtrC family)